MAEGGSARERAATLRAKAAAARQESEAAAHRAAALEEQARRWESGAAGEQVVGAELARLPRTWACLHDRLLRPGRSRVNLDHVVIGPGGVFLVDAKNWSGGVSEYDGTLWQHTGSSRSRRPAVEQVGRAAGEMERTLAVPVVPVLALAGGSAAAFDSRRVGGIDIVPVHDLREWLLRQPGHLPPAEVELLRRRVDLAFPAASVGVDAVSPDTSELTVAQVLASGKARTRSGTHARRTRRAGNGHSTARFRRFAGRRTVLARGVIALGLFALLAAVLPYGLFIIGGHGVRTLATSLLPGAGDRTPSRPNSLYCQDYPVRRMKAVLATSVTASTENSGDRCRWYLGPAVDVPPMLDLQIGASADVVVRAVARDRALATAGSGTARVWVAAGLRVRQWEAADLRAPSSFMLSMDYRYPEGATPATRRRVDEAELSRIARLSEDLAMWMRSAR